jgi:hypothetical protein
LRDQHVQDQPAGIARGLEVDDVHGERRGFPRPVVVAALVEVVEDGVQAHPPVRDARRRNGHGARRRWHGFAARRRADLRPRRREAGAVVGLDRGLAFHSPCPA